MAPPSVTIGKPVSIYGLGIAEFIQTPEPFYIDWRMDNGIRKLFEVRVKNSTTLEIIDWDAWTLVVGEGVPNDFWQHDCGLEITQGTWTRAGLTIMEVVCPRCQPQYQYVWTHREGLSR